MSGVSIKQVKKIDLVKENIRLAATMQASSQDQLTSQKPQEPTSLATLRYAYFVGPQGERRRGYIDKNTNSICQAIVLNSKDNNNTQEQAWIKATKQEQ